MVDFHRTVEKAYGSRFPAGFPQDASCGRFRPAVHLSRDSEEVAFSAQRSRKAGKAAPTSVIASIGDIGIGFRHQGKVFPLTDDLIAAGR